MRALVTGGGGVLGADVVRGLLEAGWEVRSVGRSEAPPALAALGGDFEHVGGDIRDPERMAQLVEPGLDRIVHLAAALPAQAAVDPVGTVATNVLATASLFELATRAGVERFVNASTKSAYGPLPASEPTAETHPSRPRDRYGASKLAAEVWLAAESRREGAPEATSLRFASIYGAGKAARHAQAALTSAMIADAAAGRPVRIESGGDQVDDLIYSADAAAGIVAATLAPGPVSPLYNVSTGAGTTLRDFAAAVTAAIPGAEIEVGPGLEYMGPDFVYGILDPTLAREELGFEAPADHTANTRRFLAALG